MPFVKGHKPYNKKTNKPEEVKEMTENEIPRVAAKKKRVPVGLRNPMALNMDLDTDNFHYRFVRGKNSRVQAFLDGGYEIVEGGSVGEKNVASGTQMGSRVTAPSGDSDDKMYLMRIPKNLYDEDQAVKAAKVDEIEDQLKRRPKAEGLEGEIKGI